MIGRIQGLLLEKTPPLLLVNVSGVGYEIQAPMSTCYHLPNVGQEVVLLTHLIVREDAHLLYGFLKESERLLFRNLIKVSNIGPKSALAVLSGIEADNFVRCVLESDTMTLSRLPGIGKKTAERLVIEMKDRLADWHTQESPNSTLKFENVGSAAKDAISALIALGYKPQEAKQAVIKIERPELNSAELIRSALQHMITK